MSSLHNRSNLLTATPGLAPLAECSTLVTRVINSPSSVVPRTNSAWAVLPPSNLVNFYSAFKAPEQLSPSPSSPSCPSPSVDGVLSNRLPDVAFPDSGILEARSWSERLLLYLGRTLPMSPKTLPRRRILQVQRSSFVIYFLVAFVFLRSGHRFKNKLTALRNQTLTVISQVHWLEPFLRAYGEKFCV